MIKRKKIILKRINKITDKISKEYNKINPNRGKIAKLSNQAGSLLEQIKEHKN